MQDGHCPSHCACPSPHCSQTYTVLVFLVLLFLNFFCPLGWLVAWTDTVCLCLLRAFVHLDVVPSSTIHFLVAIHFICFQVSFPQNQPRIVVQRPSEGTPSSSFRTASFGLSHRFERDPLGFGSQSFPFQPNGKKDRTQGEGGGGACVCLPSSGTQTHPSPLPHKQGKKPGPIPFQRGVCLGSRGGCESGGEGLGRDPTRISHLRREAPRWPKC